MSLYKKESELSTFSIVFTDIYYTYAIGWAPKHIFF